MMDRPASHTLEDVIRFLRAMQAAGTWGTTELRWQGHSITFVQHQQGYKPGELPR